MIRHRLITGIVAVVMLSPCITFSQEGKRKSGSTEAAELASLHKLVEEQSKQIEALTEQVSHLTQLLETLHTAALATPAPTPVHAPVVVQDTTPPAAAISGTAAPDAPGTHVVTKGETLTSIAKHYKLTVGDLLKVNKIANDRMLQIGQTLVIPTPTPADNPQEKKESQ